MKRHGKASLLDANVLLRFLLGDDPAQSARASALMKRIEDSEEYAEIEEVVLAETVWVLEKKARIPRLEIARSLSGVLSLRGMLYRSKRLAIEALSRYGASNFDIADCLIAVRARAKKTKVYSFDVTDFKRLGCAWEEPS